MTLKKLRFWDEFLWVKTRRAFKVYTRANEDAVRYSWLFNPDRLEEIPDPEIAQQKDNLAARKYAQYEIFRGITLHKRAARYRVRVPPYADQEHFRSIPHTSQRIFTIEGERAIKEQIRNWWLTLAGVGFGLSSVVQAVFAFLSYFLPRH